jgi:hypothetical protein
VLILPAHSQRQACVVTDISAGGAGLQYPDLAPAADLIAQLVIEGFGAFDGITVRDGGSARGLRFLHGEPERNNLLIRLALYVEEGLADVSRHHDCPGEAKLSLTRTSGVRESCRVIQISLQGVSLMTELRPPLGELVRLGRMYGRVAGHLSDGITVRFISFVRSEPAGQI